MTTSAVSTITPSIDQEAFLVAMGQDWPHSALRDLLKPMIEAHLVNLREKGILRPSPDLGARSITALTAWNAFVAGDEDRWQKRDAINTILEIVAATAFFADDNAFDASCAFLTTGTSQVRYVTIRTGIEATDCTDGLRGTIYFDNWQPSFWHFCRQARKEIQASSLEIVQPVTAAITARTGKLLFTDTLRVGKFSDSIDFGDKEYSNELSLNSAMGRQNRTIAHAETHNLGFVQTTNTCVALHRNDKTGALLVAECWYGEEDETVIAGWTCVGTFSCDIWRVTMVDSDQAADLIDPQDIEAGRKKLADYIASNDCYAGNIVSLDVTPGSTWRITGGENFNESVDRTAHQIPDGIYLWAIIEQA